MATIKLETNKLIVIATYAPTEQGSNDHPEEREKNYCEFEQVVNKIPTRHFVVIPVDFNARVGKKTENSEDVVGNYGIWERLKRKWTVPYQNVLQKRPKQKQKQKN